MIQTPCLDKLEELELAVQKYQDDNSVTLERERKESYSDHIKARLPGILESGLFVWCRNGRVCKNATPCSQLVCPYKKRKEDITDGCAKCGFENNFTVCNQDQDWNTAHQKFNAMLDMWTID